MHFTNSISFLIEGLLTLVIGIFSYGLMPPGAAISTLFAGAPCHTGEHAPEAAAFIAYLASPACADVIRSDGMVPVGTAPVSS